jgi:hypothetical protein
LYPELPLKYFISEIVAPRRDTVMEIHEKCPTADKKTQRRNPNRGSKKMGSSFERDSDSVLRMAMGEDNNDDGTTSMTTLFDSSSLVSLDECDGVSSISREGQTSVKVNGSNEVESESFAKTSRKKKKSRPSETNLTPDERLARQKEKEKQTRRRYRELNRAKVLEGNHTRR